jgi:hypothetical protein
LSIESTEDGVAASVGLDAGHSWLVVIKIESVELGPHEALVNVACIRVMQFEFWLLVESATIRGNWGVIDGYLAPPERAGKAAYNIIETHACRPGIASTLSIH